MAYSRDAYIREQRLGRNQEETRERQERDKRETRERLERDQRETRERQERDKKETREKLMRYGAMEDGLSQSNKIAGENQRQQEERARES